MYKNVMAPVDFSSLETRALSVAKRLARQFDATLHLVRVLPPPIVGQTIPPMKAFEIAELALAEEREACRQKLQALGAEIEKEDGLRVQTTIKEGRVT
ncbi:MAG TPA: universal stress protein, partial [Gemmatimonadaceae bacterium]|nr:universal stress protein [Gemmatimonadaceae bacterium]